MLECLPCSGVFSLHCFFPWSLDRQLQSLLTYCSSLQVTNYSCYVISHTHVYFLGKRLVSASFSVYRWSWVWRLGDVSQPTQPSWQDLHTLHQMSVIPVELMHVLNSYSNSYVCLGQCFFFPAALASQGMTFTDVYAGAPVCAPSRCALVSCSLTTVAANTPAMYSV